MEYLITDYNLYEGMILRQKSKASLIGKVTKIGNNPFGETRLYEVTIIETGRKILYNINELANEYQYDRALQVLYANS